MLCQWGGEGKLDAMLRDQVQVQGEQNHFSHRKGGKKQGCTCGEKENQKKRGVPKSSHGGRGPRGCTLRVAGSTLRSIATTLCEKPEGMGWGLNYYYENSSEKEQS